MSETFDIIIIGARNCLQPGLRYLSKIQTEHLAD